MFNNSNSIFFPTYQPLPNLRSFNFDNLKSKNGPVDMELEKVCITCDEFFSVTTKTIYKENKCKDCKSGKTSKIGLCVTCKAAPVNKAVSMICNHCKMRFR